MDQENQRLKEAREQNVPWKKWGPYLSEREWGTVREDYGGTGNSWDYFPHDQARSRAYRWGEDGIAGVSDNQQWLCFALALWNGQDAILKERLFGLTNSEGNHGEDVKEYYFYLDNTPTHSYMKYLYKYPQAAYPYLDLVYTNRARSRYELEYELLDTHVFDQDRYFDVFVEYAKASPEDLLVQITVHNRGPEAAELRVLPTLWFRNTWSWSEGAPKPVLRRIPDQAGASVVEAEQAELGKYYLYCSGAAPLLFTENETNRERLFGQPNPSPYVKDGIDNYVVHGQKEVVNPAGVGTKVAAEYRLNVPGGGSQVVRLRLTNVAPEQLGEALPQGLFGTSFEQTMNQRRQETDEFYAGITPSSASEDQARVIRQALAGMLWTKQFYYYDVDEWLKEHAAHPLAPGQQREIRNRSWYHMVSRDVISMPDKWEYPWFAAWDLAFHNLPLEMVDPDFAKQQLQLMLRPVYLHPNGQLPAYEWNFGDVNPPVHAWANLFVANADQLLYGKEDLEFLEQSFDRLLMNFTWWVNRKDRTGSNVFEGGFLGLDNVGVFDRSAPLPTGGYLDQADGTAWMALYSQNMFELAVNLAQHNPDYAPLAFKFFEHFVWITAAMNRLGGGDESMWDEEDGFFYDVLRFPDGRAVRLKVRSMVGLLPVCASTVVMPETLEQLPQLRSAAREFIERLAEIRQEAVVLGQPGAHGRFLLSMVREPKLRRILAKMLDENEFLSPYGIRSLSRYHLEHPYTFYVGNQEYSVSYQPAESNSGLFGGNSNWRGPIWMPVNVLLLRALLQLYTYYGNEFTVECPTGSGRQMNLFQVAQEIATRLSRIFLRDEEGRRPVYGGTTKFQTDPYWRDNILFYEYFHGDIGAGIGASHQTGWTGLIAPVMRLFQTLDANRLLEMGLRPTAQMARPAAMAAEEWAGLKGQ